MFQPFERLGAEHTVIEGTGLGLTLAKALAEAMNGSLGVESVVDQGTTFWIELVTEKTRVREELPEVAAPPSRAVTGDVAGAVLYIEDKLSNVRLMERILSRRPNVTLLSANYGDAGVQLARQKDPDLVFLDLHLPDLPGEEVLRRLRQDPSTRNIPVIVLSGDATPTRARQLLAEGAHAYLTKPLDLGRLLQLVDDVLGGAHA